MRISDWSSDVCSSDLGLAEFLRTDEEVPINDRVHLFDHSLQIIEIEPEFIGVAATPVVISLPGRFQLARFFGHVVLRRSEEHTSELQSLMSISYAVFCLKKKNTK